MSNALEFMDDSILLIEPVASLRQVFLTILRNLGFKNIVSMASGKDALQHMEMESPSWLISPSLADQEVNFLQVLKLITLTPRLRNTLCTLFVDKGSENYILPLGFELGLFSWHEKNYSKDSLENNFRNLFSLLKLFKGNKVLTSSEYIRRFTDAHNQVKSRLLMDENLVSMFPSLPKLMLNLAESQHLNEKSNKALQTLKQLAIIAPKLKPLCAKLTKKYSKIDDEEAEQIFKNNSFGVNSCLILEPDSYMSGFVRGILEEIGFQSVSNFDDAEHALDWLNNNPEPDIIVMEWKIPAITGPIFVQRIRNLGFQKVPIIITSSQVTKKEEPLLREMNIDSVIQKPYGKESFVQTVASALQINRTPSNQKELENKIRRLLAAGETSEARRFINQLFSFKGLDLFRKLYIEAEYEFANENYVQSKDLAIEALKSGGDSLFLFNLIGKNLLKLGDNLSAIKCFEKANNICPFNLERVLNIAGAHQNLGQFSEAEETLKNAEKIDAGNEKVPVENCRLALEKGLIDKARKIMGKMESTRDIISYMNNRSISLVMGNRFNDAVELYKATLNAIPVEMTKEINAVTYNLGLALVKHDRFKDGLEYLDRIAKDSSNIYKKSQALIYRIHKCIKNGTPFTLNSEKEEISSTVENLNKPKHSLTELLNTIETRQGDMCCHLVYFCTEGIDKKAEDMISSLPHFVSRVATIKQSI